MFTHRDLKPANCLIQIDQELNRTVKVTDFGASKMTGSNKAQEMSMTTNMVSGGILTLQSCFVPYVFTVFFTHVQFQKSL